MKREEASRDRNGKRSNVSASPALEMSTAIEVENKIESLNPVVKSERISQK